MKDIIEFRKQWVAALRSGEYEQTKREWKDETGYCCLGVANAISGEELCDAGTTLVSNHDRTLFYSRRTTPKTGLNNSELAELAKMNDMMGLNFNAIADFIELNYIKPFENELS